MKLYRVNYTWNEEWYQDIHADSEDGAKQLILEGTDEFEPIFLGQVGQNPTILNIECIDDESESC